MKFELHYEDIRAGIKGLPESNPIALAIASRLWNEYHVRVHDTTVEMWLKDLPKEKTYRKLQLPENVVSWLAVYKNEKPTRMGVIDFYLPM